MRSVNHGARIHSGPPGSGSVPAEFVKTIERAMTMLMANMRGNKLCNDSFTGLSGGRTFRNMFDDHTIWINYDPNNGGQLWGWTMPSTHSNDIVITRYTLRMGRWSTAATIVHELAHLNGAPGGSSHAAEQRVKECRMMSPNGPYDPGVSG